MMMHLVAHRCGAHVPLEALWQAVLGVTDQFQRGNVLESHYQIYCDELKVRTSLSLHHLRRHCELIISCSHSLSQHQLGEHLTTASDRVKYTVAAGPSDGPAGETAEAVTVPGSEHGHIQEGQEYRFFLYRHWSLLEAMQHSPYIAAKLSVWNAKGASRLNVRPLCSV